MVTLVQLEYIVAIDTYRHYVTAAQKCYVTQPTLSMQVKKLEEQLGVAIFDRTKQPIIPTDIGKKIIEQARIVLAESKKIEEIIAEGNSILSGELTIGIIPSLAPYLLPLFIGDFTKNHPQISVNIIELLSEDILTRLKNDTIDVGILVTPLREKGIIETPLFYEKMLFFANKNHSLAQQKEINTQQLTSSGLWLLGKGHCFRSQVINLCSYQEDSLSDTNFHFESGSLETIQKLIEANGGYTLLPELATKNCQSSNTVIKEFNNETPVREVSIAYSRNQIKRRMLDVLSKAIQLSVPKEMLNADRGNIVEWR